MVHMQTFDRSAVVFYAYQLFSMEWGPCMESKGRTNKTEYNQRGPQLSLYILTINT